MVSLTSFVKVRRFSRLRKNLADYYKRKHFYALRFYCTVYVVAGDRLLSFCIRKSE